MLYRMMTDRLPFEANNDLESLLRVQKAEFAPPQEAKPGIGASVAAIIRRAMRLHPAERYQTADEMLVEVERVLRTEFQSAGQTELKSWLVQLGRRDNAPSIGGRRATRGGVVKDMVGTDLSIGTSFELRDLEQSTDQTELQRAVARPSSRAQVGSRRASPQGGAAAAAQRSHRRDRQAGRHAPARGRSGGFWLGVILTLGAVVGARYVWVWAENRGVMTALGIGGNDGKRSTRRRRPPSGAAGARTGGGDRTVAVAHARARPPLSPCSRRRPRPRAGPGRDGGEDDRGRRRVRGRRRRRRRRSSPDAHPAVAEAPPAAEKPCRGGGREGRARAPDTDEEALLPQGGAERGEDAVIGEDEAEAPTAPARTEAGRRSPQASAIPGKPSMRRSRASRPRSCTSPARPAGRGGEDQGARPRPHADRAALQDRQHLRDRPHQARLRAGHAQGGGAQHEGSQGGRGAEEDAAAQAHASSTRTDESRVGPGRAVARGRRRRAPAVVGPSAGPAQDFNREPATGLPNLPRRLRSAEPSSVNATTSTRSGPPRSRRIARARAARGSEVVREVTLPSIERLVEDADLRRASVTKPARDEAFVRDTLATARAYADRVAKGDDPYRTRDRRAGEGLPRRLGRDAAALRALRAARLRRRKKTGAPGRSSSRCTARSPTTSTTCGGCSGSTTARARPTPRPRATSCRSPTSRRSSSRRWAGASSWATTASATTTSCG